MSHKHALHCAHDVQISLRTLLHKRGLVCHRRPLQSVWTEPLCDGIDMLPKIDLHGDAVPVQAFTGGLSSFTVFNMLAGYLRHCAVHGKHGMHGSRDTTKSRDGSTIQDQPSSKAREGGLQGWRQPVVGPGSHFYTAWVRAAARDAAWRRSAPSLLGPEGPEGLTPARAALLQLQGELSSTPRKRPHGSASQSLDEKSKRARHSALHADSVASVYGAHQRADSCSVLSGQGHEADAFPVSCAPAHREHVDAELLRHWDVLASGADLGGLLLAFLQVCQTV